MIPQQLDSQLRSIDRRYQDLERRLSQHFSQRQPSVGRYLQSRLVRTVIDPDATPTYPTSLSQANTYPIVLLDGGFPTTAGRQTAGYKARHPRPQTHVHNIRSQYIPVGSVLRAYHIPGSDTSKPGEWWAHECCEGSGSTSTSTSGSRSGAGITCCQEFRGTWKQPGSTWPATLTITITNAPCANWNQTLTMFPVTSFNTFPEYQSDAARVCDGNLGGVFYLECSLSTQTWNLTHYSSLFFSAGCGAADGPVTLWSCEPLHFQGKFKILNLTNGPLGPSCGNIGDIMDFEITE